MSEQELAALQGAADDVVDTSEATENTDGQDKGQPAEDEAKARAEEKSKSQLRRERREAADQHRQRELDETRRKLADSEATLSRIRTANQRMAESAANPDDAGTVAARTVGQIRELEVQGEVETQKRALDMAQQMRVQEMMRDFAESIPEAREKHADFDAALSVAQDPRVISPQLSVMILESDVPHEIAYHLGKNPALARTLSGMNPVQAARELGRLEASLAAPKRQTAAPDPINPVKPGGTSRKSPGDMSPAEFAKWRDEGGTF